MKSYVRGMIIFLVLYFAGIFIFVFITGKADSSSAKKEQLILKLNDITNKASKNWNDLSQLDKENFRVPFVILGQENEKLYVSPELSEKMDSGGINQLSPEKAIKQDYLYKYVLRDNEVLGYVILTDNGNALNAMRIRVIIALFISALVLLTAASLFGVYIKKSIINPFNKMEEFAGKVAEGNLDEPLLMEKNNMFGVFTESFDIMREELAASRKREIALQKKEKELVASLSHDLKTPVTGIKLSAELLKAKLEKESVEAGADNLDKIEKVDNIYKKADQIDVLVTDLFTSTLEDLGEFKVNCQDEESQVLADIVRKYDDKEMVVSEPVPGMIINIDARRMSQVIGNVISNSYKYAGTKINISYSLADDFLEMKIKDFGPGIPDDELQLVTNKFYRGKQWADSNVEGSGLGLYISKTLMIKMGGELLIENDHDGLCITLLIPLS